MNMSIPNSIVWLGEKMGEAAAHNPYVAGGMLIGSALIIIGKRIYDWRKERKAK